MNFLLRPTRKHIKNTAIISIFLITAFYWKTHHILEAKSFSANFEEAIKYIFENEGFESNHPSDDGGYTKYGIAQNFHPRTKVAELTLDKAKELYYKDYWSNTKIPLITNDALRIKFADAAVHCGYQRATLLLQRSIKCTGVPIEIDGLFGKETLEKVNKYTDRSLLWVFTSEVVNFLEDLVEEDPKKKVFLKGWLSRGYLQP